MTGALNRLPLPNIFAGCVEFQLFEAVGKEPKIVKAPVLLFDLIIGSLDFMAKILPKQFEDPAELAKIGKYYAVEDMLTTDPSEKASASKLASRDEDQRPRPREVYRPVGRLYDTCLFSFDLKRAPGYTLKTILGGIPAKGRLFVHRPRR